MKTTVAALSSEHRAKLRSSALTDQQIDALGFSTSPEGRLLMPYLKPDGNPEVCHDGRPFVRYRLPTAEITAHPKDGKYRTRKGEGCRLYHSHLAIALGGYVDRLNNKRIPLRITEGELKTESAAAHDPNRLTIGIGGVDSWRDRYDGGESRPLVDLDELPIKGREVRLCFDSDVHKPTVRLALEKLARYLLKRDAVVLIERLPNAPIRSADGKIERLGLDDLIHHYGPEFFLRIAEHAEPAFVVKGSGEDAEDVFNLPLEPTGPQATFRRALWLHGLIGQHWRADNEARNAWHRWTGSHWQRVEGDGEIQSALETFLDCQGWPAARALGAVNGLLSAFRRMVGELPPCDLEGLVPCRNGLLRVVDRTLLPHVPAQGNDWALPFDWDPAAQPGPILSFLHETFSDPADVEIFRAIAQSAALGIRRKLFLELTGPANSGKSVVQALLTALVGLRNVAAMSLDRLEDPHARFETLKLRGKRLAIFSEAQRYQGPLETLKALTGGDLICAERKGSSASVDFIFDGTVLVVGNSPIRPSDRSAAVLIRRRSLLTPHTVSLDRQRPLLDRRGDAWTGELVPHLPGLLSWVLTMPQTAATAALKSAALTPARAEAELCVLFESDDLAAWADERLIFDPGATSRVGTKADDWKVFLFPSYCRDVESKGGRPLGLRNFKAALVTMLRDAYGLDLPPGLTSVGPYRARGIGSVIPGLRFRIHEDGEAPGVLRYAMQARMATAERIGADSERMPTRIDTSEVLGGTDVTDFEKFASKIEKQVEKSAFKVQREDFAISPVPPSPGCDFCHSSSVPDPFPIRSAAPGWIHLLLDLHRADPTSTPHQLANSLMAFHGINTNGRAVKAALANALCGDDVET